MANGRKTGGRRKGVPNKPKLLVSPEQLAKDRAIALMTPDEIRTPKAVMLSAMHKFERMSDVLMAKAERMTRTRAEAGGIAKVVAEAHKFTFAAVSCAEKVAPYIHARYLAIEARGEENRPAFVVRAPAVMTDSSAWQAAVGAAVMDMEAASAPVVRQNEVAATQVAQTPQAPPTPSPVVLAPDPKTNRITAMPPGTVILKPVGSEEWLDSVAAEKRRVG